MFCKYMYIFLKRRKKQLETNNFDKLFDGYIFFFFR